MEVPYIPYPAIARLVSFHFSRFFVDQLYSIPCPVPDMFLITVQYTILCRSLSFPVQCGWSSPSSLFTRCPSTVCPPHYSKQVCAPFVPLTVPADISAALPSSSPAAFWSPPSSLFTCRPSTVCPPHYSKQVCAPFVPLTVPADISAALPSSGKTEILCKSCQGTDGYLNLDLFSRSA